MKINVSPIPLAPTGSDERLVKRGALATFRLLRVAAQKACKLPEAIAVASADVRSAWQESAHPKA